MSDHYNNDKTSILANKCAKTSWNVVAKGDCYHCRESTCIWEKIEKEVWHSITCYCEEFDLDKKSRDNQESQYPLIRKRAYRTAIAKIHGHLGKGAREILPDCVELSIKYWFYTTVMMTFKNG